MSLALAGSALAVDDFQCFKAKDTAKAFVKTTATVSDTFAGATSTDFKKPFLLCDSASIAGDAQTTPAARLSCFKVKGAKLAVPLNPSVTDDFGTRSEEIKKVFVVCDGQASSVP
ncbi:MAG: hypothetical protein ACRERC_23630 [Candidatus Binatia bacterium]